MDLRDVVVIGGNTRIIAPALLARAYVIPSLSLLTGDALSLEAVASASAVVFASYRRTVDSQIDQGTSIALARIVVNRVADPRRVLYLSSDHVFSGALGSYAPDAEADPVSPYGMVKAAQEAVFRNSVILRFTVMGPSFSARPLMAEMVRIGEPLVSYQNSFFSPVSSWAINEVLADHVAGRIPAGIYHLASERISKAELLCMLAKRIGVSLQIQRTEDASADHSLLPSPLLAKNLDEEVIRACSWGQDLKIDAHSQWPACT
jgi:dTDP-4-dehydrorhamnose reductase